MLVDTGSVLLAVRLDGDAGLPWLILSNSLATDADLWDGQMPMLTAERRVLRYDTRGHGGSRVPHGPATMADLVGDVVALMDHFAIDRADVAGLSLGGMTAIGLALHHPHRLRRAVCACARAEFPEAGRAMWDSRAATVTAGGVAAIAEETLARWFTPAADPQVVAAARQMVLGTSDAGYLACVAALKGLDYARDLGKITVPMLYLAGGQDGATPPAVMQAMATATPGAQFSSLPDAAHIANMECPQAFNAALSAFLFS